MLLEALLQLYLFRLCTRRSDMLSPCLAAGINGPTREAHRERRDLCDEQQAGRGGDTSSLTLADSPRLGERHAIVTSAPSTAIWYAASSPMPVLAPVTTTRWPVRAHEPPCGVNPAAE